MSSINIVQASALSVGGKPIKEMYLNGKLIWSGTPAPVEINNLLPQATDTDRVTIYNGTGYYNGKRWSSSGNKITTGNNTTSMTGFITCKPGDILRIYNFTKQGSTSWYIITFNDSNAVVKCVYALNTLFDSGGMSGDKYTAPGYAEITLDSTRFGEFTSIRLSWGQFNSESIITINQKIPH